MKKGLLLDQLELQFLAIVKTKAKNEAELFLAAAAVNVTVNYNRRELVSGIVGRRSVQKG